MVSARYIAEALLLPRFLHERGVHAVLDAIERNDPDFFIPVWFEAGFRFTPFLFHTVNTSHRLGVIGFPAPQASTESYMGAIVGSKNDPTYQRYLTWERSTPLGFPGETGTMIGEWSQRGHTNHGAGPPFTGDLVADRQAFIDRVLPLLAA